MKFLLVHLGDGQDASGGLLGCLDLLLLNLEGLLGLDKVRFGPFQFDFLGCLPLDQVTGVEFERLSCCSRPLFPFSLLRPPHRGVVRASYSSSRGFSWASTPGTLLPVPVGPCWTLPVTN